MVNPWGNGLARWVRILRHRDFDRKPAFAENIKRDLRTSATSLSAYERALEGFVLRRHPGEIEGLTKHGEKVVTELAELQTSIDKGPNKIFSLERTQAALKDLRGVTERVQADLELIKAKPKLAADILFFENWPHPKEDPQVQKEMQEKITKCAENHIDHLDDLWQKTMLENADLTYVRMVEGGEGVTRFRSKTLSRTGRKRSKQRTRTTCAIRRRP